MQSEPTYDAAVECIDRIISKLKPETSSKMKSAVVALYTSDADAGLSFSSQICLMHLDYDRQLKTAFLRLYHIEKLSLLLELELYYGFMDSYKVKDEKLNLWGFDLWKNGTICVQFRNELEGLLFSKKLQQFAPKKEALVQLRKQQAEEQLRIKKQNSFFGKIKGIFKKPQQQKPETVILKVIKSNSVCIDRKGNFHTEHLSPEWEEILRRSGLKPADMKKKQIAQLVLQETIIYETKKAAKKDPSILASAGISCIEELNDKDEVKDTPSNETIHHNNHTEQIHKQNSPDTSEDSIPPPPIIDLPPPPNISPIYSPSSRRESLLEGLQNSKITLKPVKTNGGNFQLDASELDEEERIDLSNHIRKRMQARKAALNRRHSSDED